MRKVGDILKEIEELEKDANIINNIAKKMLDDNDVCEYMSNTFGVQSHEMYNISNKLFVFASRLKNNLENCEVDIT